MIAFPKDFPEKLRSSILVSEVVGKRVKLKQRGPEFSGLCPFHNEKSPSFTVNDAKGFYHCFGCAAHGDVIGFVMNSEGLEFRDAVVKLADEFGIAIPKVKFDETKENQLERDYLILEKATQFFEKNLHQSSSFEARNYLVKRNLNTASAKKFRLGFAPDSYEALSEFLSKEGFGEVEILRSGIVGKNDRGKIYDKMRNRIIFPISDKKNRIIAFGGRTIGDDMPKYLNSAETDIFKKNQTLYNFASARKPIFDKGYVVVVEGYMDVIALATNGIGNVVAGLGTALGIEHLKSLFLTTDKVVICLDGDAAGIRAAKRFSEIALPLINAKKSIFFTFLPQAMDPDDFIKKFGARDLESLFDSAIPLSESLLEFAMSDLRIDRNKKISAENKAKLEANLNAKIALIQDPASKKYFSIFVKDSLFLLGRGQKKMPLNFTKITTFPQKNPSEDLAKNIIAFIVKFPELTRFRDDMFDLQTMHFGSEKFTHLKELILENADLSEFGDEMSEIENIVASLANTDLESVAIKFRLLLLKDLLLQVEAQYKESLDKIDELETYATTITNQKIKEIFDYKNSLQVMILAVEKELI
jgi:DNA primase